MLGLKKGTGAIVSFKIWQKWSEHFLFFGGEGGLYEKLFPWMWYRKKDRRTESRLLGPPLRGHVTGSEGFTDVLLDYVLCLFKIMQSHKIILKVMSTYVYFEKYFENSQQIILELT